MAGPRVVCNCERSAFSGRDVQRKVWRIRAEAIRLSRQPFAVVRISAMYCYLVQPTGPIIDGVWLGFESGAEPVLLARRGFGAAGRDLRFRQSGSIHPEIGGEVFESRGLTYTRILSHDRSILEARVRLGQLRVSVYSSRIVEQSLQ